MPDNDTAGDRDATATLEALPSPVVVFDAAGRVSRYNAAAVDAVGDEAALADAVLADRFDGLHLDRVREAADTDDRVPALLVTAAGGRTPVVVRAATRDDHLVVVLDERPGDWEAILARMTDAFFAVDEDWRLTYVNEQARTVIESAMTNPPDGDLRGTHLWEAVPDAVDTEFYDRYHDAMATQEPVAFESFYEPLDAWIAVRAYPSETGLSVYFRDVTERRRQEDALREHERVLREMHDVTADTDRSFTEQVNALLDLGTDVLGTQVGVLSHIDGDVYEFEAVRGDTDTVPGDTAPLSATNCEHTAATEQTLVMADVAADAPELTEKAGYAEWGISSYLGAPVFVDGDVYGTFCFYGETPREEPFSEWEVTLVDLMSQWVGYELTRQRARDRLEAQNERLEQFASIVSHDLRNPLSVLDGYLELAAETGDPEHIEQCQQTVDRMADLVEDLLALARTGEDVVDLAPTSLSDLAWDAWESIDTGDASLTVATDATVVADETRATQVFANLFQNAVEHAGSQPAVTVGWLDDGDGFYVEDDGPGIPDADLDDVFEPGYSTNADGTGFGLHIVADVADAHGWRVNVTESERGGARFEVEGVEEA